MHTPTQSIVFVLSLSHTRFVSSLLASFPRKIFRFGDRSCAHDRTPITLTALSLCLSVTMPPHGSRPACVGVNANARPARYRSERRDGSHATPSFRTALDVKPRVPLAPRTSPFVSSEPPLRALARVLMSLLMYVSLACHPTFSAWVPSHIGLAYRKKKVGERLMGFGE